MTGNPNLLTDPRVPQWLRDQMQAVSFEAECLAALGVDPQADTEQGRRFAYLFQEAERCANVAVPYIYGHAQARKQQNPQVSKAPGCGNQSGPGRIILLVGGIIAITCACALIII